MTFRQLAKRLIRPTGYDITRFDYLHSPVARRRMLMMHYGIDLLLDVGANDGGYGLGLRRDGYRGRIVSFEPLRPAFEVLERRAQNDPLWEVEPFALGDRDTTAVLNVARNSESSSLLEMLPRHVNVYSGSAYNGRQDVEVRRLDALFDRYYQPGETVLLKIDTQGYERPVLDGASAALDHIVGVQVELSLVPLYRDEPPLSEMVAHLEALGYTLMSIEPVFGDPVSGQLLQADGLFFRARS